MRRASTVGAVMIVLAAAEAGAQRGVVDPGMTREQVVQRLGEPAGSRTAGAYTYLYYRNGCERACGTADVVMLQSDAVVDAIFRSSSRRYTGASTSPAGARAQRSGESVRVERAGGVEPEAGAAAPRGTTGRSTRAAPATPTDRGGQMPRNARTAPIQDAGGQPVGPASTSAPSAGGQAGVIQSGSGGAPPRGLTPETAPSPRVPVGPGGAPAVDSTRTGPSASPQAGTPTRVPVGPGGAPPIDSSRSGPSASRGTQVPVGPGGAPPIDSTRGGPGDTTRRPPRRPPLD